jgi:hypothetical protein
MLSEKEKNIVQALVEDEVAHVIGREENNSALLSNYRRTLNRILLKLKMDNSDILDIEYGKIMDESFLSRQAV